VYTGRRALAKPDRIDNTSAKARTPQGCRAQRSATLATPRATLEAVVGAVDVRFGGETVVTRCRSACVIIRCVFCGYNVAEGACFCQPMAFDLYPERCLTETWKAGPLRDFNSERAESDRDTLRIRSPGDG